MEAFKFPDEIEDKDTKIEIEIEGESDVDIEIVDDTPEKDRGRPPLNKVVEDPSDDEIESYSGKVQQRIKELTHARHDERRVKEATMREKQELERLAQQLIYENNNLKKSINYGQEAFATTTREKAESEMDKARRQLKDAHEAFDTDAIIAAQEAMTDAKMRFEAARNFRPTPLQETQIPVQTHSREPQRVEPDEQSLRWQAKNQWFGSSGFEEYTSYALGLHQKLVNGGVDPRSGEYFDQIDGRMKSKFPELFGREDKSQSNRRPTTVVASASRSTSAGKVRLTTTQVALAKKLGLTPQQYAVQVQKLEN
jgi:cellobiose-specific phosphotransferase system component IIA